MQTPMGGQAPDDTTTRSAYPAGAGVGKKRDTYTGAAVGAALFLSALLLYVRTLAPSVMPGDYAEFQMCAAILGIPHPTGYPLYVLLGKLFTLLPLGDVAYRVNLSSAVYMAGAVAMLYAATSRLLRITGAARWSGAAAVGAVFFALAPTVWSMSLVARSYALNALLVASLIFCLIGWRNEGKTRYFYMVCALVGLSLVHHGTTYLLLPAYGIYLLLVERERAKRGEGRAAWGRRAKGLLFFLAGYSPILFLVYRFLAGSPYYWGNPTTWKGFFNLLGGGPFQNQVLGYGAGVQLERIAFGIGELLGQYTVAGVVLGVVGLGVVFSKARGEAMLLALMMLGNFAFAMNYSLVGYLYFIPTYLIWGVLVGIGAVYLLAQAARFAGKRSAYLIYGAAGAACLFLAGMALFTRFSNIDQSSQTQVRDETLSVLREAPQGASLYMDWEDISVVRFYRLVYGMRTDLTLHTGDPADWAKLVYCDVSNGIAAYVGEFSGAEPPLIARDFVTVPAPLGWRVVKVSNAARYEIPPCATCATCR